MKLQMNAEARRRALVVDRWWRDNRPKAADLFVQELTSAFELLVDAPRIGVVHQRLGRRLVYRYLLQKTQQHVYYWIDERNEALRVLNIWGAARRPPSLR